MTWKARLKKIKDLVKAWLTARMAQLKGLAVNSQARKILRNAVIALAVLYVAWNGIARIAETEVGVLVNNITPMMTRKMPVTIDT